MLDKQVKGIVAVGTPQELRDQSDIPMVRRFFSRQAGSDAV
jgi:phospholipid/cholesterol/gamma-HCH transport system ATP-binding protein